MFNLKRERNYGMPPYPIYQGNPGIIQPMPVMAPGMAPGMMPGSQPGLQQPGCGHQQPQGSQQSSPNQEINNLNRRLDNLERRVSELERTSGTPKPYNNNFTDSNYQMI